MIHVVVSLIHGSIFDSLLEPGFIQHTFRLKAHLRR